MIAGMHHHIDQQVMKVCTVWDKLTKHEYIHAQQIDPGNVYIFLHNIMCCTYLLFLDHFIFT